MPTDSEAWYNIAPVDHRVAQVIRWCSDELAALLTEVPPEPEGGPQ